MKQIKLCAMAAICVIVLCVSITVCAAGDIPEITSLITVEKSSAFDIKVIVPQLHGRYKLYDELNEELTLLSEALVLGVKELRVEVEQEQELPVDYPYSAYAYYTVESAGSILSLRLTTYCFTGGANGITSIKTYNIDTVAGAMLSTEDLFQRGVNGLRIVQDTVEEHVKKAKVENSYYLSMDEIRNYMDTLPQFYINNDGQIMLQFQKYDIAAGAAGPQSILFNPVNIDEVVKPEILQKINERVKLAQDDAYLNGAAIRLNPVRILLDEYTPVYLVKLTDAQRVLGDGKDFYKIKEELVNNAYVTTDALEQLYGVTIISLDQLHIYK